VSMGQLPRRGVYAEGTALRGKPSTIPRQGGNGKKHWLLQGSERRARRGREGSGWGGRRRGPQIGGAMGKGKQTVVTWGKEEINNEGVLGGDHDSHPSGPRNLHRPSLQST